MATGPGNPIARYVQEVVGSHEAEALSDGQLLERFVARREEAIFHVLLRRHGPMVQGVCRRWLHDPHQADDAFQATFLVLVRRAEAIGRREAVGAWLYRVAFRIAARSKMKSDRQRQREGPIADVAGPPTADAASSELRLVLDEELNRLPRKYRDPLVLRYLEEKPNEEVAAQLSWPLGTVKTRLGKARELLRERLAKRGLALTAVALEAALGETTSAAVHAVLAEATAQAALLAVAGQTAGTAGAILLTEGVLHEMLQTKFIKGVFGAVLTLGLLAVGTGWLWTEAQAEKPAAEAPKPKAPQPAPAQPALPDELKWLPNETTGFLSIRVDDLWDGEWGQELRRQLPKEKWDGLNPIDNFLGILHASWTPRKESLEKLPMNDRALGLDIPNLRRLTLLIPAQADQNEEVVLAITTREPYARKKILQGMVPGAKEKKVGEKSYHAGTGLFALYFADAHTFVIFSQRAAAKVLPPLQPKKGEGPLQEALALAATTPLVFAMTPSLSQHIIGPLLNRDSPLIQAGAISFGISLNKELRADWFLNFPNQEAKDKGVKAVKQAIALAEVGLATLRQEMGDRPQALEKILKIMARTQVGLADIPIRQEGNRLHVPLRVPVDGRTMAAALGEVLTAALPDARKSAQRIAGMNNLKQIALAMHRYHDKEAKFPAAAIFSKDGKPLLSWRVAILPYIEQEALYKKFKLDEPWDSENNKKLLAQMPKLYAMPGEAAKERDKTIYQVFNGKDSIFEGKKPPSLTQITNANGSSNTVLVVEAGEAVPWTKPADLAYVPGKPLPKLGGDETSFLAVFADGHVQRLPKKWFEKNASHVIEWLNVTPIQFP